MDKKDSIQLKLTGSEDLLIETEALSAIYEQPDEVAIRYKIEGLTAGKHEDRYNQRKKLKASPPVLHIDDNYGNSVSFKLTEGFAKDLYFSLDEVNKAYSGYIYRSRLTEELEGKGLLKRTLVRIKNSPKKIVITLTLLIIVIYLVVR